MESRTSSRTGISHPRKARPAGSRLDDPIEPNDVPSLQSDCTESIGEASAPSRREQRLEGQEPQSIGIVGKMKERAATQLTTQKDRATEGLGMLAHAVRHTTERLRDEQHETVATYVERAAEQLERLSSNLRGKDVSELLQDAQRLARRQPALFIGGSFAIGLLAARFLKSSREAETRDYAWTESLDNAEPQVSDLPGAY
jgi:HPt (histidine-containing phosphotransfer) domain-containing protein